MTASSEQQYRKMTETPIPKLVMALGIPTTISMLVTNIYNMADTYFVGKLGTSASGAVGIMFGIMAIIQAFGFMLGHGAGSNISRKLGAKEIGEARIYASTSFFSSLLCGSIITILGLLFLNPLMRLLGSTETILPYARGYGIFILLAAPAMASSCVMNNILRYEGRATFAMIGLTAGGILNIFGDMLFMQVFDMGIYGAGLSTALSQYISMAILLSMFLRGKTQSKFNIKYVSRKMHYYLQIISVGFPSMTRQGLASLSTMILNLYAAPFGDAAIAAMSITSRVANFMFCVGLGIGQGFQPVSAFNYGAKKYQRVKKACIFTMAAGIVFMFIFAVIGFLNSAFIIKIFRDDNEVIRIGTFALKAQCLSLVLAPISVCGNMLFQSIGKSGRATFLACLRSGLCYIPALMILTPIMSLTGIEIAQPVADAISALLTMPLVIHFFAHLPQEEYLTGSVVNE